MPTNLKQFNAAMENIRNRFLGPQLVKFHKAVSLEVFKRIVLRTPVDTGRARGNWQFGINRAIEDIIDIEGDKFSMANAAMTREIGKLAQIKAFSIVHITNNIEYVYYLEYERTSEQHPEGMVEITLAEMKEWVSKL